MPTVIMPKMGDGMDEGTLLRWLKEVGQDVTEGEPIAEIETDKVSIEIEATEGGVFTKMLVGEGDTVPVGTPIATIGEEAVTGAADDATAAEPAAAEAAPVDAEAATTTNGREPAKREEAAVARAAPAEATQSAAAPVSQPPTADDAKSEQQEGAAPAAGSGERLRASPLVKRLAAEHGIDLQGVAGSGPGGRIVKDDISHLLTGASPAAAAPAAEPAAEAPADAAPTRQAAAPAAGSTRPPGTPRELSRIRRSTGRRMAESKRNAPHFYVTSEVDMAPAAAFREQVNSQVTDDASQVSFNDLIVKACALALRDFPNLNTSYEDDRLIDHPSIDINVAVAIEGGLIAPFIPNADEKSLGTIARMAKDLIGRARNGGLTPEEFQGGTFTVSNLGMYDVEEFIGVINPPQAAILAVGSIKETPVVASGKIVVGQRMNITLSADHRVSDGAEVARCLQAIKHFLENPMLLALS